MSTPRLVIVTPRYWPQVGEAEMFAANLACELAELGARPLILTGKWCASWPEAVRVREIEVFRVPHAPRGGWSTFRYMIDIARWLRRHLSTLDCAYVVGLRHEAYATLGALRGSAVPTLLCCEGGGAHGDCEWQASTRLGQRMRQRCRLADGIVVSNSTLVQELAQCGYMRERLHVIPSGVRPGPARTADQRFRARAALADANYDLAVAEYAPVMVHAGRLTDFTALSHVLHAWRDIARRWPSARFWLIGEGAARDALYERIIDWELRYQVFMPGTFEDLTDVWLAADLFVAPPEHSGWQMALAAMASGLPVVAPDSESMREIVEHGRSGLLVPAGDRAAWSAALGHFCDYPAASIEMGAAAQRLVAERHSPRNIAERHVGLLNKLKGVAR